jgi:hypothetical protein
LAAAPRLFQHLSTNGETMAQILFFRPLQARVAVAADVMPLAVA